MDGKQRQNYSETKFFSGNLASYCWNEQPQGAGVEGHQTFTAFLRHCG